MANDYDVISGARARHSNDLSVAEFQSCCQLLSCTYRIRMCIVLTFLTGTLTSFTCNMFLKMQIMLTPRIRFSDKPSKTFIGRNWIPVCLMRFMRHVRNSVLPDVQPDFDFAKMQKNHVPQNIRISVSEEIVLKSKLLWIKSSFWMWTLNLLRNCFETENIRQHVDLHINPTARVYIIYYTYTIIFYVMQQHLLKGGSYITVYIYVN